MSTTWTVGGDSCWTLSFGAKCILINGRFQYSVFCVLCVKYIENVKIGGIQQKRSDS